MPRPSDPYRVENVRALITGAGTGIGRATALSFAEGGAARLILVGRRAEKLLRVADEIRKGSPECDVLVHPTDVADPGSRDGLTARMKDELDRLDVLVNNAGYFDQTPLRETTDESWRKSHQVNLEGPFMLIRDLVDLLAKSENPGVINVSTTLAEKPIPGTSAYNATKAGLVQMTRTLALELGPEGIRVNAILPAVVETDMYRARFPDEEEYRQVIDQMSGFHPLGRVGKPEDIAQAIRFLASRAASWVTGVALPVDGGMLCT